MIVQLTQRIEYWAAQHPLIFRLAAQYYRDIIKKEVQLAKITADDHILCIGSGPCPFSAILLHQLTGAKITAIDNELECTRAARQLIASLKLEHSIKVLYQDGLKTDVTGFTVIMLAVQVSPIGQVFAHLEKQATPGTRLLVRKPKDKLQGLYSNGYPQLTNAAAIFHKKTRNVEQTLLYVKKGASP